jgi:hypothetical protein
MTQMSFSQTLALTMFLLCIAGALMWALRAIAVKKIHKTI